MKILMRLGYNYLPLKKAKWDENTIIFHEIFVESILRINQKIEESDALRFLEDIKRLLENEDLGKAFYEKLIDTSGIALME